MKKIYEYEGKKYKLVKGEALCKGCCFRTRGEEGCEVLDIDEMDCVALNKDGSPTFRYIFKELKPEEGKP
jgi:hypothetical protein